MKKIKIEIEGRWNWHDVGPINVIPLAIRRDPSGCGENYLISARTYARIKRHFCGIADCRCSSGPAIVDYKYEGADLSGYWIDPV